MKKIACNMIPGDWLKVSVDYGVSYIKIRDSEKEASVELTPDKIRKLRKQLKRALIEIEGVSDESL